MSRSGRYGPACGGCRARAPGATLARWGRAWRHAGHAINKSSHGRGFMSIHRFVAITAFVMASALFLSGCDGYCASLHGTPSLFCSNDPSVVGGGTGGGAGGGAPGGPGCDACDDGQGERSRTSVSTAATQPPAPTAAPASSVSGTGTRTWGRARGRSSARAQPPNWRARHGEAPAIAIENNIKGCANQTGIMQNRTIGVDLRDVGAQDDGSARQRWKMLIPSQARQMKKGEATAGCPRP